MDTSRPGVIGSDSTGARSARARRAVSGRLPDMDNAGRLVVSLSPVDRAIVLLGGLVCAAGIGFGIQSSAAAADRAAATREAGPTTAAPAGAGGAAKPKAAVEVAAQSELDWSVINTYDYVEGLKNLPAAVQALDGKPVVLRGFLTPLYEFDDIHEFVLVANHMSCCFGVPAGISGQVQVKLAGEKGLPNTNEPLEVRGTFRVVETKEQGYILSIYRIDDAKVRIVGYK